MSELRHEGRPSAESKVNGRTTKSGQLHARDGSEAIAAILDAALFAAQKHSTQRRKDADASPYINHPLALARVLATLGEVTDPVVLGAALLHDTVEDTKTTFSEIEARFGAEIANVVREVTDDKELEPQIRKRLQIETAAAKSPRAKLVKLADKVCNLQDILACPPADWPGTRKLDYFEWAARVVDGLRGSNDALEDEFDRLLAQGRGEFGEAAA